MRDPASADLSYLFFDFPDIPVTGKKSQAVCCVREGFKNPSHRIRPLGGYPPTRRLQREKLAEKSNEKGGTPQPNVDGIREKNRQKWSFLPQNAVFRPILAPKKVTDSLVPFAVLPQSLWDE